MKEAAAKASNEEKYDEALDIYNKALESKIINLGGRRPLQITSSVLSYVLIVDQSYFFSRLYLRQSF